MIWKAFEKQSVEAEDEDKEGFFFVFAQGQKIKKIEPKKEAAQR